MAFVNMLTRACLGRELPLEPELDPLLTVRVVKKSEESGVLLLLLSMEILTDVRFDTRFKILLPGFFSSSESSLLIKSPSWS